ncbi:MAG: hypothetical protein JW795_12430 [Chitinivibrionales bacterium]|nr:hypothetical protein [Chitinivibrionales bacterium]
MKNIKTQTPLFSFYFRRNRGRILTAAVVFFCSLVVSAQLQWNRVNTATQFTPRADHVSAVFDSKIWVIGGYGDDSKKLHDIWNSSNGETWTKSVDSAVFSMRVGFGLLSFKNALWIIAGWNGC